MTRLINILGIGGTLRPNSTSLWALEHALRAAQDAGAVPHLFDLNKHRLPMYEPDQPLSHFNSSSVEKLLEAVRKADGFIISTGGYHGTLAGVTKNALDFMEFLSGEDYFNGKPVGLIATAGGEQAAINSINALVHVVHSLYSSTLPLSVPIPDAENVFDAAGHIKPGKYGARLEKLGHLVFKTAEKNKPLPAIT